MVDNNTFRRESPDDFLNDSDIVLIQTQDLIQKEGYFLRPNKVTYRLTVPENMQDYVHKLSKSSKKKLRKALRVAKSSGIEFKIAPLTDELFELWNSIYLANLSTKKLPIIRATKDKIKVMMARLLCVYALKDGVFLGGILLLKKQFTLRGEIKTKYSISYSATNSFFKKARLGLLLNYNVIAAVSAQKCPYLERGIDSNLYGHYLSPGLFLFKKSLGFRIVAKGKFGFSYTKILNFSKFSDPLFFITIEENKITGNLFSRDPIPKIKLFSSTFPLKVFKIISNSTYEEISAIKLIVKK